MIKYLTEDLAEDLEPRLFELLNKEGNTTAEIEEIKSYSKVIEVKNLGYGNSFHPDHEQISIIIKDDDNTWTNYKI